MERGSFSEWMIAEYAEEAEKAPFSALTLSRSGRNNASRRRLGCTVRPKNGTISINDVFVCGDDENEIFSSTLTGSFQIASYT